MRLGEGDNALSIQQVDGKIVLFKNYGIPELTDEELGCLLINLSRLLELRKGGARMDGAE